ncbi:MULTISPECIES: amino acid adenylation domain-containing protein [unclassified Streptomyces]|uniref:amino acid adenylation domain-containing protein n=1 Tax=unclassified Streptomyces TaxID=2593676 RepID=UPI000DB9082B|nr:amino acid adenylation domain-containing protein [Streptomyces sp. PsTaAH-130]MYU02761.1 amino acid adenylation domain-containing protein [Streptomyces sp. SID8366]MYU67758.1 amino acid adenylation domain-containing protein [Streptomyces sp. SID69]RAJ55667.1 amino acid adenylation domain-containing protein [Streptomyces sp. PsTaAH-130]
MRTVADDIAAHALRHPGRTALSTPAGEVSYARLAARTEEIARLLRARGARPETVCAVAVEHGTDAVASIAAVLRCGAAFLTLDVSQPRERLTAFVRSAGARLLLTHAALAPALELGLPTVLLDQEEPPDGPLSDAGADPRALAYVSHTSGSTGEPSAVLVEHASLDAYLRDTARAFGLGPDTVALQSAPLGYDASIRDTFVPLLAGARLVIVDRARLLRPAEFAATVREHGVTALLSVTPSFLTHLGGQTDLAEPLAGVELVASSGESLRPFLAAGGRSLVPGRLVNQYGPTECTMTTTRHGVPAAPDPTADLVGTPREGTVVRVLDAALAPVPDGTVGEVYIGGCGVTRGYGGQPARTAAAFVPDPLGPPGSRLYRTGDLGHWGPGGLHYTGRTDRQLKIRGYRVDPAEIEGALLSHPGVTGAVVTPHTDDLGRVHLLAHVTGALSDTTDATLRRHLARTLPPHLMPRRFVRLETLPTTRAGKADRRVLAAGRPV